ncbi:hypothetical protein [uncultured Algimonas sp.]|uniref:hypothetical protein n=1 Tax=uncultured Algimonas sp. TaxID=1547920 RepID=UPI002630B8BA|nr:hypothetical protein [uncultured Algimonas sp.]
MFWTSSSSWMNFSPRSTAVDPAFHDNVTDPEIKTFTAPERKKPSFSNAADRASRTAMALRLMRSGPDNADRPDDAVTDAPELALETDAQPVREATP